MTKATTWTMTLIAVVLVMTGGVGSYLAFHDYSGYFLTTKGHLAGAKTSPYAEDDLFSRQLLSLGSDSGLKVECGLLVPKNGGSSRRYPAVVLLGGVATGKQAVEYVTGISHAVIVAPDYPYRMLDSYNAARFLKDLPAMRGAALDLVPSVMLIIDYLARRPDVDPARIVLVGYSFGAQFVPCLAALDRRPAVAVMVFGGGDLRGMIRVNMRRLAGKARGEAVGLLGSLLLRPLEPLRYADRISPVPLLMLNGSRDRDIPPEYAIRFFNKAKEPKKLIWLDAPHMNPKNVELTRKIVGVLKAELVGRGILSERD